MARPELRVYYGPGDVESVTLEEPPRADATVEVKLGEIFPLLADAVRSERTWLDDFAGDEITISSDLYEVILAYQHFRRPSA
ncbi:MAG: hypothetical protein IIA67_02945 [Planctomycetes bacterium]|nr:hypothetical protein [Planctomycetota bacterium]